MQRVLTGTSGPAIRHEHFSALLIGLPAVSAWLAAGGVDVPLVLSAVLTHHLKAAKPHPRTGGFAAVSSDDVVRLSQRDGAFTELAESTGQRLGRPCGRLAIGAIPHRWVAETIRRSRGDAVKHLDLLENASDAERRRLWAVRSALIAADAAGSGSVRTGPPVGKTLWEQFVEREPWAGETVWSEVIDKRVADLNRQFARRTPPRQFAGEEFQDCCAGLPDRALVLAPCGSGKTLAAWRWIAAQAGRRPVGRVLFLYPTRATAKEGFRDYVSWATEADATLMHDNAAFDLTGLFGNGADPRHGNAYETDRQLFALGYWLRRVFSATVDQFQAFLQYGYGPICMLPVLADSVIVVDEVHSFDRHMFTALKKFLTNFDVPVLCMTATLPEDRKAALKACGLTEYADKPGKLKDSADAPRYTLARIGSRNEAFAPVRAALAAGQRVLWVANTVRRCHEVSAAFAPDYCLPQTADGVPVYCYHSQFKLADRVDRHEAVIRTLKVGRAAALA